MINMEFAESQSDRRIANADIHSGRIANPLEHGGFADSSGGFADSSVGFVIRQQRGSGFAIRQLFFLLLMTVGATGAWGHIFG